MSMQTHLPPDWQHLKPNIKYSVTGIYDTKLSSDAAMEKLKEQGFKSEDVSVLIPDKTNLDELNTLKTKTNRAGEGTATGLTTGAVLGGAFGWLIGIGAFSVNGVGPFFAAEPIISAIAGAGIGGIVGGISGAIIGLGIPAYEAKKFAHVIKGGGIRLSVHCKNSDWINRAKKLLEITGAHDITSMSEA